MNRNRAVIFFILWTITWSNPDSKSLYNKLYTRLFSAPRVEWIPSIFRTFIYAEFWKIRNNTCIRKQVFFLLNITIYKTSSSLLNICLLPVNVIVQGTSISFPFSLFTAFPYTSLLPYCKHLVSEKRTQFSQTSCFALSSNVQQLFSPIKEKIRTFWKFKSFKFYQMHAFDFITKEICPRRKRKKKNFHWRQIQGATRNRKWAT